MSYSVDFDQTAHIQEQSDLCLHPFLRPINPFSIFFDLWCEVQATGVNLAFFPRQKNVTWTVWYRLAQFPHQSGKEINKVLTLIRLLLCNLIRVYTICKHLRILHPLLVLASFIHTVQIVGNAMCREGYFSFLKKQKEIWASKFFYRTSDFLFHLSCRQVVIFWLVSAWC